MSLACEVSPVSAFMSTNLNNKIECYGRLGDRIKRSLGWPLISLEIHQDQLFENIQIAIEYFSKYAGYTQEYIIFNSQLYEKNRGIRLDTLFTIHNTGYSKSQKVADKPPVPNPNIDIINPPEVYINIDEIPSTTFTSSSALSGLFPEGVDELDIIDEEIYTDITSEFPSLTANFKKSKSNKAKINCEEVDTYSFSNVFDYDIMDYRKVIEVTDFEEGSSNGVNTLFTIEQTLAQQNYFGYALGNFGFDLTSWYTMKEFIDTREKMLATRKDLKFDPRTQYLTIYPQPSDTSHYYGVLSCYVERPIRDLIKEQWVYQYASALTKITIGRVRGKFGNVELLGGGGLNYDLLEEGRAEKEELETKLLEGASAGLGDSDPVMFIVG